MLVQIPQGIEANAAKDAILKMDPNKLSDGYMQIDFLGYAEPGSPSTVVNFAKALPTGHYAFVCFVPSAASKVARRISVRE